VIPHLTEVFVVQESNLKSISWTGLSSRFPAAARKIETGFPEVADDSWDWSFIDDPHAAPGGIVMGHRMANGKFWERPWAIYAVLYALGTIYVRRLGGMGMGDEVEDWRDPAGRTMPTGVRRRLEKILGSPTRNPPW
jgi:hypothetical protein